MTQPWPGTDQAISTHFGGNGGQGGSPSIKAILKLVSGIASSSYLISLIVFCFCFGLKQQNLLSHFRRPEVQKIGVDRVVPSGDLSKNLSIQCLSPSF